MLRKVAEIFAAAGLEYKETKYTKPPQNTYFVAFDHESLVGPDLAPGMLREHEITIEAYEPRIDTASESALEAAMTNALLNWTRSDRAISIAALSAAVGKTITAISKLVFDSAEAADELGDMSKKTGLSVEQLQKYRYPVDFVV